MSEDTSTLISFIHVAIGEQTGSNHRFEICAITEEQAQIIYQQTGVSVSGYKHVIDDGAVRHTLKKHGKSSTEEPRGQITITESDFFLIPDIVIQPDAVKYAGKNSQGLDILIFEKKIRDVYFYAVEIRTGRRYLAMKTMYKRKAPNQ